MRSDELYSIYQKIYILFNPEWYLSDWLWFCHLLSIYSHKISIYECIYIYDHVIGESEEEKCMRFEDFYKSVQVLSEILYRNKGSILYKLEMLFKRFMKMDSCLEMKLRKSIEAHRSVSPLQHMLKCSSKLKSYENIFQMLYFYSLNMEYSTSSEEYIKEKKIYPNWNDIVNIMNKVIIIPKLSNNKFILQSIQYHDGIINKSTINEDERPQKVSFSSFIERILICFYYMTPSNMLYSPNEIFDIQMNCLIERIKKKGIKISYSLENNEEQKKEDIMNVKKEDDDEIEKQKQKNNDTEINPMIELHKNDILFSPTTVKRKTIKRVNEVPKLYGDEILKKENKITKPNISMKKSFFTPNKRKAIIKTGKNKTPNKSMKKKSPKKILSNSIPFGKVTYYNNNNSNVTSMEKKQVQQQFAKRKLTLTNSIVIISYSPSNVNNNIDDDEIEKTKSISSSSSIKKRKSKTIPFSEIKDKLLKLNNSNLKEENNPNISLTKLNNNNNEVKIFERNNLSKLNESSIHQNKNEIIHSFVSEGMINNMERIEKEDDDDDDDDEYNYSVSIPLKPFQSDNKENSNNVPIIYQLYSYLSSITPITTYNLYCHLRHFHIIDKICTIYDAYNIIKNYSFTFNDEIIPFSDFNNIMNDILDIVMEDNNYKERECGDYIMNIFSEYSRNNNNNNNNKVSSSIPIIYDLFSENSLKLLDHLEMNISELIDRIIPNINTESYNDDSVLDILMIINQNLASSLFIPLLLNNEELVYVYNLIPESERCEMINIEWLIEYIILISMKSYHCEDIFITLSAILEYL